MLLNNFQQPCCIFCGDRIVRKYNRSATDLGAGEKEVLALGTQVPGAVVILDERLGRLHAGEGRIPRIEPLLEHLGRFGIPLVDENPRGSPQAGWTMSLGHFLFGGGEP